MLPGRACIPVGSLPGMGKPGSDRWTGQEEIERALLELMEVALRGDGPTARDLCRRWVRKPPVDRQRAVALRAELRSLLTAMPDQSPLRGGGSHTARWAASSVAVRDLPRDPETNQALLRLYEPNNSFGPVLDKVTRRRIDLLIAERPARERLIEFGLQPSRSILISGPPGVGKTMTASYIAEQMKLPLLTVDLASVMSSYLGRTGRNIRTILDYAAQNECVLFIDEFDALAKRRDDNADVGELKRLVNVLLLELDRWPAKSFLIAATNHLDLLDSAIARRFDTTLKLSLPKHNERSELISQIPVIRAAEVNSGTCEMLTLATQGFSHSEIVRLCNNLAREAIVDEGSLASLTKHITQYCIRSLQEQAKSDPEVRSAIIFAAHENLGYSNRKIANLLGISHPTVSRVMAAYMGSRGSKG